MLTGTRGGGGRFLEKEAALGGGYVWTSQCHHTQEKHGAEATQQGFRWWRGAFRQNEQSEASPSTTRTHASDWAAEETGEESETWQPPLREPRLPANWIWKCWLSIAGKIHTFLLLKKQNKTPICLMILNFFLSMLIIYVNKINNFLCEILLLLPLTMSPSFQS